MNDVQKTLRLFAAAGVMTAIALTTPSGAHARGGSSGGHDHPMVSMHEHPMASQTHKSSSWQKVERRHHQAAKTSPRAITNINRIRTAAQAAQLIQMRFPALSQQYIAVLNAGGKITGPLRAQLTALSQLANKFGLSFSAGTVLLIGKLANGGVIGPAV